MASRPSHSASVSASLSGPGFDLGLMASGVGLTEIGLVASNIYLKLVNITGVPGDERVIVHAVVVGCVGDCER